MKAVVLREGRLEVDVIDDPTPGPGQVLVRTLACGICGSDLHTVEHGEEMAELSRETAEAAAASGLPTPEALDLSRGLVMGHEFCAEVLELGEGVEAPSVGDRVVSMPVVLDSRGIHPLGYSNEYPGGFGEMMVLSAGLCLRVPDTLDADTAALCEPMAVAVHAVNRAELSPSASVIVVGCGPIGLGVIAAARASGCRRIAATDLSQRRLELAAAFGADEVFDASSRELKEVFATLPPGDVTVFEAVGVPGMIDRIIRAARPGTRVVVVGVCMQEDSFRPLAAVTREVEIRFAFAYRPDEFASTLQRLAEGILDPRPMITATVALDAVPGAFEQLRNPERHAKILVTP
ncbi:MAG: hypothetical zinc-type alcohol dehydrogenase [Acidimicrobiales bacterium]|nr:MAG: hypothetical zinc-type alcohol dehydrogenase [Acidimicrobiales bacterium]